MFKRRSLVRCIDNKGMEDALEVGQVYLIIDDGDYLRNSSMIIIEHKIFMQIWCFTYRFELVEEKDLSNLERLIYDL